MFDDKTITLILPCRNEEAALKIMLPKIPAIFDEVIVVDNASTDESASVAAALGARVVKENNPGYGNAYKAGFAAATGDIIVTMDADDTYPIFSVEELLREMRSRDLDFITVRRMHLNWEKTVSLVVRFIGKKVLDFTASLLVLRMLHDSQSGMWIFKKDIIRQLTLKSPGMPFSEEIKMEAFVKLGRRAAELPCEYEYRRREGKSKLNLFKDGLSNLFYLFTKRIELSRKR